MPSTADAFFGGREATTGNTSAVRQAIQKVDSAIHCIEIDFDPPDNAVGKPKAYPLDNDLSCG